MHRYIWLIPLLPLAGAAVNGLLGRRLRLSERTIGAVAVGSVALAFLLGVAAVVSYGWGAHAVYPRPYLTSEEGGFPYSHTWIPGGAVEKTLGAAQAGATADGLRGINPVRHSEGVAGRGAEAASGPSTVSVVGPEGEGASARARVVAAPGGLLDVEWSYQLDPLSSIFILVVTGVGLCIFVFATGYMHGDPGFYRFFAYLGLFMFSMLILVMGSNFLMMFVGWEGVGLCSYLLIGYYFDRREAGDAARKAFILVVTGVGLCSYLLIGYYFDRREAGDAARKAFITNRIGDFGFALAVFAVIAVFGSTQYTTVMESARTYPIELLGTWGIMSWIALGLFIGACGKSAQIPLYVWLPDAMAGPTPVSALIHAATMVTAGLYMVTRTNVIFQHSQTMMLVVAVVGAATALFAATIGITQNDIKKVLAYSTVSQLGFMFLACGVGAFAIGIFHVMTHAFFKALMFLGAGSVIHGMHHEQDMRRMGNLRKYMPKTYLTFLAGWLAICGIIPFSGFWSKDEILWNTASTTYIPYGWLLWLVATIAATCTAFYMTRLVAMTFWGRERFLEVPAGGQADEAHAHAHDEGEKPHDARTASAGDRPRHEPGEHVGVVHMHDTAQFDAGEHLDSEGRDVHDRDAAHARDAGAHDAGHGAHAGGGHGHGGHGSVVPHESPASMWVPLAVLAVLAVVGGFVGISTAFTGGKHVGGRVNIVNWLQPVIWNPATGRFGEAQGAEHGELREQKSAASGLIASSDPSPPTQKAESEAGHGDNALPYGDTGFNLAHAAEHALGSHTAAEWLFIIISLAVAALGIGLGVLFYVKNPRLPEAWAARLGPLYRASFNKYWVDELYGAAVTRRTMDAARGIYGVDSKVLDGAVNGTASLTRRLSTLTGNADRIVVDGAVNGVAGFVKILMSPLIRAAQTGLTPNYALVMVLGLVASVAFFFWRDIWAAMFG